jgi:tetratricopeptide (TPR) repeat protein
VGRSVQSLDSHIQVDATHRRGYTAALTKPLRYQRETGSLDQVSIELATHNSKGVPQSSDVLQRVLLHEAGHALGLWGHSQNGFDVMSPHYYKGLTADSAKNILSDADQKTLQILYVQGLKGASVSTPPSGETKTTATNALLRLQAQVEAQPSWQGYWNLARHYRDAGLFPEAETTYAKACRYNSQHAPLFLERVQALQRADHNEAALGILKQLPVSLRTDSRLLLEQAWVLLKLSRMQEAQTAYSQAIQYNPSIAQTTEGQAVARGIKPH